MQPASTAFARITVLILVLALVFWLGRVTAPCQCEPSVMPLVPTNTNEFLSDFARSGVTEAATSTVSVSIDSDASAEQLAEKALTILLNKLAQQQRAQ